MSKHIDADALAYLVASNGDADFINKVARLMIDAQSIDLVRCKNCKYNPDKPHKYYDDDPVYSYIWCPKFIEDLNGKGFCPYGAEICDDRKGEDDD